MKVLKYDRWSNFVPLFGISGQFGGEQARVKEEDVIFESDELGSGWSAASASLVRTSYKKNTYIHHNTRYINLLQVVQMISTFDCRPKLFAPVSQRALPHRRPSRLPPYSNDEAVASRCDVNRMIATRAEMDTSPVRRIPPFSTALDGNQPPIFRMRVYTKNNNA